MALAVCLLFNRRSERAVRALWDRLEEQGVPSLRSHTHGRHLPHVSYVVLRRWDQAAVTAALSDLACGEPVELNFDGIGLFRRGRTWLVAGVTADFVTRQQRVVDAVSASGAELHKHYLPGVWLPHCSLAPRDPGSVADGGGGGDGRPAAAVPVGPRRPGEQRDRRGQPSGGAAVTLTAGCLPFAVIA